MGSVIARAIALVVLVVVAAPLAHAQPTDPKQQARAAFGRAVAAEGRDDWRAAIVEYDEAYRLAPHPDVLYNLAAVYERIAEARAAAEHYQRYLDTKDDATDRVKVERKITALRSRPSKIAITTTPAGALVIVDGQRKGPAPVELTLGAGSHQLVAEAAGAKISRTIVVEYGEPQAITLPVVVARGTLVVTSNVAGASIVVDGNPVGVAPWRGALDAGRHIVVVSAPGYTTVERTVDVPGDGTAQIIGALGRPLGHVEPSASRGTVGLFGADLGSFRSIGIISTIYYGYRSGGRHLEGDAGMQFGAVQIGFTAKARAYVFTGRVRPYLGVTIGYGGASSTVHAVGGLMLADLPYGRAQLDLFVEAGFGTGVHDAERKTFVPIIAGLSAHLGTAKP